MFSASMPTPWLWRGCRNRSNLSAAAAASRFHPNYGYRISHGGLPTPAGKSSVPLLMISPQVVADFGDYATDSHYNFLRIGKDLRNKELIRIKKKNKLPWEKLLLPDDAVCMGSSHGWLALVHPRTCQIGLFNPFVSNSDNPFPYIPLPRIETLGHRIRIHKVNNLSQSPTLFRQILNSTTSLDDKFSPDYKGLINKGDILLKLALSSAPNGDHGYEEDCIVVAVVACLGLHFCKLGDSAWTVLKGYFGRDYDDVIYSSKHRLYYAVANKFHYEEHYHIESEQYHIESWDFTDPCCPKNTLIQPSMDSKPTKQFPSNPQGWRVRDKDVNKEIYGKTRRYLVEDSGNLLLVLRFVSKTIDKDGFLVTTDIFEQYTEYDELIDDHFHPLAEDEESYITVGFAVYKMDWIENKWEPVESLGDKALFVGINHSFAVSTPDVTENSIYFTDDMFCKTYFKHHYGGHDSGVYNMENASISGFLPSSLQTIQQLPVWALPN